MTDAPVTLQDMIECAKREVGMRKRVYPAWVEKGKMKPEKAALEIERMEAIVRTLEALSKDRP